MYAIILARTLSTLSIGRDCRQTRRSVKWNPLFIPPIILCCHAVAQILLGSRTKLDFIHGTRLQMSTNSNYAYLCQAFDMCFLNVRNSITLCLKRLLIISLYIFVLYSELNYSQHQSPLPFQNVQLVLVCLCNENKVSAERYH